MVGQYSVAPSEYWGMSPAEVLILLEFNRPKRIGSFHEDQFSRLIDMREQMEAKGIKVL